MTSGERMVWAVAFVSAGGGSSGAQYAARCVTSMVTTRDFALDPLKGEARAMLDDMLGNGADR